MEAFTCDDFYPSLHRHYRWYHAEIRFQVYEVSSLLSLIMLSYHILNERSVTSIAFVIRESLQFIAEGGSFAEEVISTIRTAQAFGTQLRLSKVYGTHIDKAFIVDHKAAAVHGLGLAIFFFIIYASYGLAFQFGTTLILEGHGNVGTVINVSVLHFLGSGYVGILYDTNDYVHGCGRLQFHGHSYWLFLPRLTCPRNARSVHTHYKNFQSYLCVDHPSYLIVLMQL